MKKILVVKYIFMTLWVALVEDIMLYFAEISHVSSACRVYFYILISLTA